MRRRSVALLLTAGLFGTGLGLWTRLRSDAPASEPQQGSVANATLKIDGQQFHRWGKPREVKHLPFSDENGKPVSLADFRGKVILLNLWAPWCPPCREEMPSLDRLNAKRRGAGFEVLTLSLDTPARTQRFLQEIRASTLRGYTDDQGRAMTVLGVTSVPTTLLIDSRGREIGRLSGAADWEGKDALQLIDSYLKASP